MAMMFRGNPPSFPRGGEVRNRSSSRDSASKVSGLAGRGGVAKRSPRLERSWRTLSPELPDQAGRRDHPRVPAEPSGHSSGQGESPPVPPEYLAAVEELTSGWERGQRPNAESFLDRLGPVDPRLAVELIYREFCLAEDADLEPDPAVYIGRFPRYQERLKRLFDLHRGCPSALLQACAGPSSGVDLLPEVGDEIGPYRLRRELGQGAWSRVFLAEQADLDNRMVVVKLTTRPTREPWLLARARHCHIVDILFHSEVDDGAFQLIAMPFLGGATLSAVLTHRRQLGLRQGSRGELLKNLDAVAAPEYCVPNPNRPAREILASLTDGQALAWIVARLAEALDHAFSRDIAHGDVKPSNILLTADGNPMLLDFDLARNWSVSAAGELGVALGGTQAYMAPERLRAIATSRSAEPMSEPDPPRRACDVQSPGVDSHRADIYSLGMVLLESLTGAPPATVIDDCPAAIPSPQSNRELRTRARDVSRARGI